MVGHDDGRPLAPLRLATAVLLGGLVLSGCEGDQLRPLEPEGGEIFDSYVALGNSLTAGLQSAGINDSTQRASYAVMVAGAMGTEFNLPLLAPPGCPPPLVNVYTGRRVGGASGDTCLGRVTPPPPVLHNVAVPGAEAVDALHITGDDVSPNVLTTLILGGRTQVEAALQAEPTFASVWLGTNDVLEAALSGDTTAVTPPSAFASRYSAVLDSLAGPELEGVLIGVPDVTVVPHLSPGAAYWQAYQSQPSAFPPTFSVHESCSPTRVPTGNRVPFGYAFGQLIARAAQGDSTELNCAADPPVLLSTEIDAIRRAVQAYNATIREEATERGWAYVDPNVVLRQLPEGAIPTFPNISGPDAVQRPFGEYFSKDGIHPSRKLHRTFAGAVVRAINEQYDTGLTPPGS